MAIPFTIAHEFKYLTEGRPGFEKLYGWMWYLIPDEARDTYAETVAFDVATEWAQANPGLAARYGVNAFAKTWPTNPPDRRLRRSFHGRMVFHPPGSHFARMGPLVWAERLRVF